MTHEELINDLISNGISMVDINRFYTILRNFDNIQKIKGDVVECGIWRGGMSIFLSSLFSTKNIWACDSFDGFQSLDIATYNYHDEPHTPSYSDYIRVRYDDVIQNFNKYGFDESDPRINFLKGWVKDTLSPDVCKIRSIALLRIDVDAYSATREVLDYLYPKVKKGGYIIFDDSCLIQTVDAFCDFFEQNNIPLELRHPVTDEVIDNPRQNNLPCGCYTIKK
jgi:O-methyltransferase